MTTIIIQGPSHENEKIANVIKDRFILDGKVVLKSEDGLTTLMNVETEDVNTKEFSEEETLKALDCCAYVQKRCADCPYRKVKNCSEKMMTDSVVVVHRMFRRASAKNTSEDK